MIRLVGCCFPYALYIPYVTLVIHDGTRFRFLDPIYLYNLITNGNHVTFSIPRIRARKLQWVH